MSVVSTAQEIICEFLRSNISDPRNRYTSYINTITATAGQQDFNFSATNPDHIVRAIYKVEFTRLHGTTIEINKWQDYEIDYVNKKIIINFNARSGDIIKIYLYASEKDWIYPDFPVEKLGINNFPRVSVVPIMKSGVRQGRYDTAISNTVHLQIDVWTKDNYSVVLNNKNYTKQELASYIAQDIETAFIQKENQFYPKLYNFELLDSVPIDFDVKSQTYRHKIELILKGDNIGI